MHKHIHHIALFVLAWGFSSGVQAQQNQAQQRKPPQEALQACQQKTAQQECEFTAPHGKVAGRCSAPEGKPLACKPTNPRKPQDASAPRQNKP